MAMVGMSGPRRFRGLSLLILLGVSLPCGAQTASEPPPSFTRTQYQWALVPLDDTGLESAYQPLAASLMVLLASGWKDLPEHEFTLGDLQRFQNDFKTDKIRQEEKTLQDLLSARDGLLFKAGGGTPADYSSADSKILQSREKIQYWKNFDPRSLGGNTSSPLKRVQESEEKPLLIPPDRNYKEWMKSKALDLVVGGRIRSVKGYIYTEIEAWDPEKNLLGQWTGWFTPDESAETVQKARSALTAAILGRLTCDLTIRTDPPSARIYLDGVLQGVGIAELPYWEPGDYILKLEGTGLVSLNETISLSPGEVRLVDREMQKIETGSVRIVSLPEGAGIYLGNLWLGKTPLEVPVSTERSLMQLFLPGFEESSWSMKTGSAPPEVIILAPQGKRETILSAKDRFYLSLAVFSVSFAGTALVRAQEASLYQLYGNYVQYVSQDANNRYAAYKERLDQSYTLYQASYYGGWTGIGVSVLSFGWLLWELYDYINAGEASLYH